MSLRRLLADIIEEYARHTGHATGCVNKSGHGRRRSEGLPGALAS
jgi:hypothetical protein